jgi:DsbC/DsbD-like thiol-disulfide interchange protein
MFINKPFRSPDMKKLLLLLGSAFIVFNASAQVKTPVKWSFSSKKIKENTYEVRLTAAIEEGWHTYSQSTPDGGPIPTTIVFANNPLLILEGKVKEVGKLEQKHEKIFGVDVKQFSDKVDFVQVIRLKRGVKTSINGSVEFMVCDDKECLPPATQKFSIALK